MKISNLRNIVFRLKNKKFVNLAELHKADTVSITFTLWKNESYFKTVTQYSKSSSTQNPVIIWANIYRQVISIKGATLYTPTNAFYNPITKRIKFITSDQIPHSLRWVVE